MLTAWRVGSCPAIALLKAYQNIKAEHVFHSGTSNIEARSTAQNLLNNTTKHKLLFQEVWMQNDKKDQDSCRPAQQLPSNSQVVLASYKKNCLACLPSLWPLSPSLIPSHYYSLLNPPSHAPNQLNSILEPGSTMAPTPAYHPTLYKHTWRRVRKQPSLICLLNLLKWNTLVWEASGWEQGQKWLENGLRMSHEEFDLNQ